VPLSGTGYGLVPNARDVIDVAGRDGTIRRLAAGDLPLRINTFRRYSAWLRSGSMNRP
jgi:formate-dependent phosphoribosylglycinamide formyltransferase (GAR transformylase)